jgi:cation transporter-like permease
MNKRAVALALLLLIVVIIGCISMVVTGLYPIDSRPQLVAIALGTSIAAAFAIFIALKWKVFA